MITPDEHTGIGINVNAIAEAFGHVARRAGAYEWSFDEDEDELSAFCHPGRLDAVVKGLRAEGLTPCRMGTCLDDPVEPQDLAWACIGTADFVNWAMAKLVGP